MKESEKDEVAYKDLIKRLKEKGLVLIEGVWQKPKDKTKTNNKSISYGTQFK